MARYLKRGVRKILRGLELGVAYSAALVFATIIITVNWLDRWSRED